VIANITISEKSFGSKSLMSNIRFTVEDAEKIGVIGRNGVGKSTLFDILAGSDKDYTGEVQYKAGAVVVSTQQEHHDVGEQTVLQYVLQGLPEYSRLSHVIETYPQTMGDDLQKIHKYTEAVQRFDDKGFYQIEEQIERELDNFQLPGVAHRAFKTLSGGQKRLVEVVKIMHSQAHLALIDEPTNHMDYVAKAQFIEWLKHCALGGMGTCGTSNPSSPPFLGLLRCPGPPPHSHVRCLRVGSAPHSHTTGILRMPPKTRESIPAPKATSILLQPLHAPSLSHFRCAVTQGCASPHIA